MWVIVFRIEYSIDSQNFNKKSNAMEYIESNIQNSEILITNYHIIKYRLESKFIRFIEGILEVVQVPTL